MNLHVGGILENMALKTSVIQMEYVEPTFVMYIGHPGITEKEVHEIQYGALRIALSIINDEALFFLFATGDMPWADAPFEPNLTAPSQHIMEYEEGEGAPVIFVAVDTNNGEVKAMRVVGLTTKMSNRLTAFFNQRRAAPFDKARYHMLVNAIYDAFPTSEAMLRTVDPDLIMVISDTTAAEG